MYSIFNKLAQSTTDFCRLILNLFTKHYSMLKPVSHVGKYPECIYESSFSWGNIGIPIKKVLHKCLMDFLAFLKNLLALLYRELPMSSKLALWHKNEWQQQLNWTWLHLGVMMKIWAKVVIRPASAGSDDGGEVGSAQQGVFSCTHSAPENSLAQLNTFEQLYKFMIHL